MTTVTEHSAAPLTESRGTLFRGLAEPSRLLILHALAEGPLSVSEIAEASGLSQPNTSNHLACLLGCGLVVSERRGRFVFYRHADERISHLLRIADQIVLDPSRSNPECPQCGSRR